MAAHVKVRERVLGLLWPRIKRWPLRDDNAVEYASRLL